MMKTMRRIGMIIFLSILIGSTLWAQGKTDSAVKKEVVVKGSTFKIDTSKPPEDREYAVVYMNVSDIFASYLNEGIKGFNQQNGTKAYITGANDWTAASQYDVIETLITKNIDGIAIAVSDDQTITPLINKGLAAGIPIVCVNSDAPSSNRLAYLGRDDVEAGRTVANYIVEKLKLKYGVPKGKILLTTTGAGANWSDSREKGSREIFAKYNDIQIVDFINATGDEQTAYGSLENALLAHPDIDAMCNMGGTMDMWGRLMKNTGRKDIISVGNDLYGNVLNYIDEGYLTASYGQRVYEQAFGALDMLYNFYKSEGDPASFKDNDVPYYIFLVDSDNVEDILAKRAEGIPIG